MTPKKFFPLPGRYGVMQMDPVAMVEHLQDQEALRQAKEMHTGKYIAYLVGPIELPWPNRPWYGYYALLVGPTLRPEDEAKAITSDMCIPIAPNTAHPTGRPPLVTEPSFPFSNCYHWVDSDTRIRIRSGGEFYEAHAVQLPTSARIDMQDILDADMDRAYDVLDEREAEAAAEQQGATKAVHPGPSGDVHLDHADNDASSDRRLDCSSDKQSACDCSSCSASSRPPSPPWHPPHLTSLEAIAQIDPFGLNEDEEVMYYPLVDFCFDLTDHLTQAEIANPVEYWKEEKQVVA
ncbi:hypothetical protein OH77DRAFT_1412784 [Trametes cingulata]|nr:hypothetical protein OH77DRAFT_1412784 [Trametes cingulata]